jgi:hypothetical protein
VSVTRVNEASNRRKNTAPNSNPLNKSSQEPKINLSNKKASLPGIGDDRLGNNSSGVLAASNFIKSFLIFATNNSKESKISSLLNPFGGAAQQSMKSTAGSGSSESMNSANIEQATSAAPPSSPTSQRSLEPFNSEPISPSSFVLENSRNGLIVLNKVETLQSFSSMDVNSGSVEGSNRSSISGGGGGGGGEPRAQMIRVISMRSSLKTLCDEMRRQILSRAFYGWLAYHRYLKTVSIHLIGLVNCDKDRDENEYDSNGDELEDSTPSTQPRSDSLNETKQQQSFDKPRKRLHSYLLAGKRLDEKLWSKWLSSDGQLKRNKKLFYKIVYFNGIEQPIRKKVWPFLLEHYTCEMSDSERCSKDELTVKNYNRLLEEWRPFDEYIHQREQKKSSQTLANNSVTSSSVALSSSTCDLDLATTPARPTTTIAELSSAATMTSNTTVATTTVDTERKSSSKTKAEKRKFFLFRRSSVKGSQEVSVLTATNTASARDDKENKLESSSVDEPPSKASTFLSFNLLKKDQQPQKQQVKSKYNTNKFGQFILRNDSSISNDVFMEDGSTSNASSILSRFSAKNLFAKLMNRDDANVSTNVNEQTSEVAASNLANKPDLNDSNMKTLVSASADSNENKDNMEIAKVLVKEVIENATRHVNEHEKEMEIDQQQHQEKAQHATQETNQLDHVVNKTATRSSFANRDNSQSESVYMDTKTGLSNAPSSQDIENEIYHDVESDLSQLTIDININGGIGVDLTLTTQISHPSSLLMTVSDSASMMQEPSTPKQPDSEQPQDAKIDEPPASLLSINNKELLDGFAINIHRIDKDVTRCDRNYWYFVSNENLKKLKNIMYTYVYQLNILIQYILCIYNVRYFSLFLIIYF